VVKNVPRVPGNLFVKYYSKLNLGCHKILFKKIDQKSNFGIFRNFGQKSKFSSEIEILGENRNFGQLHYFWKRHFWKRRALQHFKA